MTDEELIAQMEARRRWKLIIVLAVIAAVILLPVGTWLVLHFYWQGRLHDAMDGIRADGDPATWQEVLDARVVPMDPENSALVLLDAFDVLAAASASSDTVVELLAEDWQWWQGAAPSAETRDITGRYIEDRAEALEIIRQAAQLPGGAYPLDTTVPPFMMTLDYLAGLRHAARFCASRAAWQAASGDPAGAVETLSYGPGLAASLDGSVTLIDVLVRVACDAIWLESVQRVLELTEPTPDDLARLRELVTQEEQAFEPRSAFVGERAAGLTLFGVDADRQAIAPILGEAAVFARVRRLVPGWAERDQMFFVHQMTAMIDALEMPGPARMAATEQWDAEYEAAVTEHPLRYLLSAMFLPALSRSVAEVTRSEARLRCAQVALAVEEWRARHGAWPETLQRLVPKFFEKLPLDPFTGEPLKYVVTGDTVVIYSVGPDGLDDGGITASEVREAAEQTGTWDAAERWDEPFRLLRPELRGARQRTFRDEVLEHNFGPSALEEAGYTPERLKQLGFTDEELESLGFGP